MPEDQHRHDAASPGDGDGHLDDGNDNSRLSPEDIQHLNVWIEPLLREIQLGRTAELMLKRDLFNRGSIAYFPPSIEVTSASGITAFTPLQVFMVNNDGHRELIPPGIVVPANFSGRFEWQTTNQETKNGWPVMGGSFGIATVRDGLAPAQAWQLNPDQTKTAIPVPTKELESQVLEPVSLRALKLSLEQNVVSGENALATIFENPRFHEYVIGTAEGSFNSQRSYNEVQDQIQNVREVAMQAIGTFVSRNRPPTTFLDFVAKRSRRDLPRRTKPTDMHEEVAKLAGFAATHIDRDAGTVTPEELLDAFDAHVVASSRRATARQGPHPSQRLRRAQLSLSLASRQMLNPLSIYGDERFDEDGSPIEAAELAVEDNPTRVDDYLALAERITVGSGYRDLILLVPGFLRLELEQQRRGRWTVTLFDDPSMLGFKHLFEPLARGLDWDDPRDLVKIRKLVGQHLGVLVGHGDYSREATEASWSTIIAADTEGRPALTHTERATCLRRGAQMAYKAGFELVAESLLEAADISVAAANRRHDQQRTPES